MEIHEIICARCNIRLYFSINSALEEKYKWCKELNFNQEILNFNQEVFCWDVEDQEFNSLTWRLL